VFGGSAYVLALLARLPGEYGWIKAAVEFLKMTLKYIQRPERSTTPRP
jgi:hypothetical protein